MFGLGMGELVVIFFIILLLFGAKNLPEMAKALGKSVKDFRRAANDIRDTLEVDISRPEITPTGQVAAVKTAGEAKVQAAAPAEQPAAKAA